MSTRILLVDLESVQPAPTDVGRWIREEGSAWIFHGPHQKKTLPQYEALGPRVTLVPISRCGKNSLDFHLVFYLGYLTARNPKGTFAVLSRDKGYDPAITHARTLEFDLLRIDELGMARPGEMSTPDVAKKAPARAARPPGGKAPPKAKARSKPPSAESTGQALESLTREIRQLLQAHAANRPKSLRALERYVRTHLGPKPAADKVRAIVERLISANAVRQENDRLVYFANGRPDADTGGMVVSPEAAAPPAKANPSRAIGGPQAAGVLPEFRAAG